MPKPNHKPKPSSKNHNLKLRLKVLSSALDFVVSELNKEIPIGGKTLNVETKSKHEADFIKGSGR